MTLSANEKSSPNSSVVALGANLGDRRAALDLACDWFKSSGFKVVRRSRLYWTRPFGGDDQPEYLNGAVVLESSLVPAEMIQVLNAIERGIGRRRENERRWGPREIDLDLLLCGDVRYHEAWLTLPHPRIAERDFVLMPLIDLQVPPDPQLAPQGWQALLEAIPPEQRTILRSEPWESSKGISQ